MKESKVKIFFNNVKKGGSKMKKGLIAAGAAAVAGIIGTVALAIVGSKDSDEPVDAEFCEVDDDDAPTEDGEETTEE